MRHRKIVEPIFEGPGRAAKSNMTHKYLAYLKKYERREVVPRPLVGASQALVSAPKDASGTLASQGADANAPLLP